MGKLFNCLNESHRQFISEQPLFFTASAANSGRINVSPKGYDSLRVIDDKHVAYLDLTGSGNETSAHIEDNGRLTIMFCSFSNTPLILRLYGHARVILSKHDDWSQYESLFPDLPGKRQVIELHVESVQTSCGFAVPHMHLDSEREQLSDWARKKEQQQTLKKYHIEKNARSLDGLPTSLLLSGALDE